MIFMLNFNFNMPTRIVCGEGCIAGNSELLGGYRTALIVTGKSSAKASGALDDMTAALTERGVRFELFDEITENPLLSTCFEGGRKAFELGAELIVAIGGGSALDAGKAIAAYAALFGGGSEPSLTALFEPVALVRSLPIIAVPTTAGTGSEVNPYAVMTLDNERTGDALDRKKTFNSPNSYPKVAFLDPRYTKTMSQRTAASTALDALCHCVESYMSPKSTAISQMFAVYGAKLITIVMGQTGGSLADLNDAQREMLLYASCAGGLAINTTGTGFPHPLGYNLTFGRGIPHGAACAIFMEQFLRYTAKSVVGEIKIEAFLEEIGSYKADAFTSSVVSLAKAVIGLADGEKLALSDDEIERFVAKTASAGNYKNNPYVIDQSEMREIYKSL